MEVVVGCRLKDTLLFSQIWIKKHFEICKIISRETLLPKLFVIAVRWAFFFADKCQSCSSTHFISSDLTQVLPHSQRSRSGNLTRLAVWAEMRSLTYLKTFAIQPFCCWSHFASSPSKTGLIKYFATSSRLVTQRSNLWHLWILSLVNFSYAVFALQKAILRFQ